MRLQFCIFSCSDHVLERFRCVLRCPSLTFLLVVPLKYTNLAPLRLYGDFGEVRETMLRYNSGSSDFWKKCDFNLHSVAEIVCYAYVHDICTLWIFEREKKSQKNSLSDSTFSRSISLRLERSDLHNKKKMTSNLSS